MRSLQTLEFGQIKGEVFGSTIHAETHVSSSGGGGYVHQGSGYVSAPTVRSRVLTKQNFWLRQADGTQTPINLTNAGFPITEKQQVTAVYGRVAGDTDGTLVLLVNHSAGLRWYSAPSTLTVANIEPYARWPIIPAVVLIWAAGQYSSVVLAVAAAAFVIYRIGRRIWIEKKSVNRVEAHLEQLAQSLLNSPTPESMPLPALAPALA